MRPSMRTLVLLFIAVVIAIVVAHSRIAFGL
jgi:hypothetical protein